MRNITIAFLNYYIKEITNPKPSDILKDLDACIHGFIQNYVPDPEVDFGTYINTDDVRVTIKRCSNDICSHIRQVIDYWYSKPIDDYIDTFELSIYSIYGKTVCSMSPNELEEACDRIRRAAESCPVLAGNQFDLEFCDNYSFIRFRWLLPIPLNTTTFAEVEIDKVESNFLLYFKRYFDTDNCSISSYDISCGLSNVAYFYDNIVFPKIYYRSLGLSNELKLNIPSVMKTPNKSKIIPFKQRRVR